MLTTKDKINLSNYSLEDILPENLFKQYLYAKNDLLLEKIK